MDSVTRPTENRRETNRPPNLYGVVHWYCIEGRENRPPIAMTGSMQQTTEPLNEQTDIPKGTGSLRFEVLVRSVSPHQSRQTRQRAVFDQLASLEQQGLVEDVDVTVVGKAVRPDTTFSETDPGRSALATISRIREWAHRADAAIDVPIEERQVDASLAREQYRKFVLPTLCLAVYEDEELVAAFPHVQDGTHVTISEYLSTLGRTATTEADVETSA